MPGTYLHSLKGQMEPRSIRFLVPDATKKPAEGKLTDAEKELARISPEEFAQYILQAEKDKQEIKPPVTVPGKTMVPFGNQGARIMAPTILPIQYGSIDEYAAAVQAEADKKKKTVKKNPDEERRKLNPTGNPQYRQPGY